MKMSLIDNQRQLVQEFLYRRRGDHSKIAQATIALTEDASGNLSLTMAGNIGELLKDSDPEVRLKALEYLVERGWQSDIVPVNDIVECLRDEDETVRKVVVDNLWDFEQRVSDALIAKILAMLDDKNPGVVDTAIQMLTYFWDRLDDEAIRTVISHIGKKDKAVQISALKAIARFIGTCDHVVEMLEDGLIYDLVGMMQDDTLRPDIYEIIDYLGADLKVETFHKIADMLNDEDAAVRDCAAEFLSLAGQDDLVYKHTPGLT